MGKLLVGEYLLKRLEQLGIKSIFGVPGGKKYTNVPTSNLRCC